MPAAKKQPTSNRMAVVRHRMNSQFDLPPVYPDEAALEAQDLSKARWIKLGGRDDAGLVRSDGVKTLSPEAQITQFEAQQLLDHPAVQEAAKRGWLEIGGVEGRAFFNAFAAPPTQG